MKLRTKFQDEDFELGEVVDADVATMPDGRIKLQAVAKAGRLHTIFYDKLEKLYEDWEDYEEPKEFWFVDSGGEVEEATYLTDNDKSSLRNFGNYFETKEEAEKAVEKLKAWKRLKDKGFKFEGWHRDKWYCGDFTIEATDQLSCDDKDLDLLFGGEE